MRERIKPIASIEFVTKGFHNFQHYKAYILGGLLHFRQQNPVTTVQRLGDLVDVVPYAPKFSVGLGKGGGFDGRAAAGSWAFITKGGGARKSG